MSRAIWRPSAQDDPGDGEPEEYERIRSTAPPPGLDDANPATLIAEAREFTAEQAAAEAEMARAGQAGVRAVLGSVAAGRRGRGCRARRPGSRGANASRAAGFASGKPLDVAPGRAAAAHRQAATSSTTSRMRRAAGPACATGLPKNRTYDAAMRSGHNLALEQGSSRPVLRHRHWGAGSTRAKKKGEDNERRLSVARVSWVTVPCGARSSPWLPRSWSLASSVVIVTIALLWNATLKFTGSQGGREGWECGERRAGSGKATMTAARTRR